MDTSALIAGILSSSGGAEKIISMGEQGLVDLLISTDVLAEADRNFEKKLSPYLQEFRETISRSSLNLVDDPSPHEIKSCVDLVGTDDAPILAAALKAQADYLITWNTRDFMFKNPSHSIPTKIRVPGDFINEWNDLLS